MVIDIPSIVIVKRIKHFECNVIENMLEYIGIKIKRINQIKRVESHILSCYNALEMNLNYLMVRHPQCQQNQVLY